MNQKTWLHPSQYRGVIVTVFEEEKEDQNEYNLRFKSYGVHSSYNYIMTYNNQAYR